MHITIEADLRSIHIAPESMHVQLTEAELAYLDEELPVLAAEKLKKQPAREISFLYCFADSGPANTRVFHLNKGLARRLHAHINNLPGWKATLSVSVRIENYDGCPTVIPVVEDISVHP